MLVRPHVNLWFEKYSHSDRIATPNTTFSDCEIGILIFQKQIGHTGSVKKDLFSPNFLVSS